MKSKRDEFYQRKEKEKEGREVKKSICARCYNRISDWEVYKQTDIYLSQFWRLKVKIGLQHGWMRALFQVADFILCPRGCGKRGKGLLGASFIRALIAFMAPYSWLKHLPNTWPPYAITLERQDFNIWICGGNIQTIAERIQRDPQRKRSRSMFLDLQVIS